MAKDDKTNNDEIQLVAFKLAKEEYTVPINSVQEIIMPQPITHIPKTPDFIEGIINLRGQITPIIGGRKRFNMSIRQTNVNERIIVLELYSHKIGLIVDSVSEVVRLRESNIESSPISFDKDNFVAGIGKVTDRLLILIDPERLLKDIEIENLKNISLSKTS